MTESDDLQKLREDLLKCQASADRQKLGMVGVYISHAIDNIDVALSATPAPPVLRALKGGKPDS